MMQISKTISSILDCRKKAQVFARDGFREQSDEYIIEAYINAYDLLQMYGETYFTDSELVFLNSIIDDFEKN